MKVFDLILLLIIYSVSLTTRVVDLVGFLGELESVMDVGKWARGSVNLKE